MENVDNCSFFFNIHIGFSHMHTVKLYFYIPISHFAESMMCVFISISSSMLMCPFFQVLCAPQIEALPAFRLFFPGLYTSCVILFL